MAASSVLRIVLVSSAAFALSGCSSLATGFGETAGPGRLPGTADGLVDSRVVDTRADPPTVALADGAAEHQSYIIPVPQAPSVPFRPRSDPPERLAIPSIGLNARVIPIGVKAGSDGSLVWETAAFAVGHHQGTANPGDVGNVVLSGHISSPNEGSVFQHLPQVKIGDGVVIGTAQQHHLYRVTDMLITSPMAVEILGPTGRVSATLITCVPDGIYTHRLVVRAEAV